jgi:hypothetical protein
VQAIDGSDFQLAVGDGLHHPIDHLLDGGRRVTLTAVSDLATKRGM